jgi:uncharacterized membrane protein YqhA
MEMPMAKDETKTHPLQFTRYLALIAVVFSALASLLMFFAGAQKTIKAFRTFFFHEPLFEDAPAHLDLTDQTMIFVLQAMDTFLIALVLLIFSFGVFNLFIAQIKAPKNLPGAPWAQITTIEGLKKALVEVVLVVLAVLFLWELLLLEDEATWNVLVAPIGIVLLAAALRLVNWHRAE